MANRVWCLSVAFFITIPLILSGCSDPAQIPTSYVLYNSKGGTFQCDVPEAWEAKGGGTRGRPEWAKFSSGTALIHVKAGIVGSLLNDMAGGFTDPNTPPQFEPVHLIHVAELENLQEEYDEYTELPGSPLVLNLPLGSARVSEFTAKGSIHGYRASIMGHNKMLTVFCTCQESEWKALQPTFDRLLLTIDRGENY